MPLWTGHGMMKPLLFPYQALEHSRRELKKQDEKKRSQGLNLARGPILSAAVGALGFII